MPEDTCHHSETLSSVFSYRICAQKMVTVELSEERLSDSSWEVAGLRQQVRNLLVNLNSLGGLVNHSELSPLPGVLDSVVPPNKFPGDADATGQGCPLRTTSHNSESSFWPVAVGQVDSPSSLYVANTLKKIIGLFFFEV